MEQNSFGDRKRGVEDKHTDRKLKLLSHITKSYRLDQALDISSPVSVNKSFLHFWC